MGGLKHMDVAQGQADQACGEIRKLRETEVEQVLSFITGLVAQRDPSAQDLGKPERLLEHQSAFSFNEGERAKLLQELATLRNGGEV
jgi:hypothetical protein